RQPLHGAGGGRTSGGHFGGNGDARRHPHRLGRRGAHPDRDGGGSGGRVGATRGTGGVSHRYSFFGCGRHRRGGTVDLFQNSRSHHRRPALGHGRIQRTGRERPRAAPR